MRKGTAFSLSRFLMVHPMEGMLHQLGRIFQIEFVFNVFPVGFNGSNAEM